MDRLDRLDSVEGFDRAEGFDGAGDFGHAQQGFDQPQQDFSHVQAGFGQDQQGFSQVGEGFSQAGDDLGQVRFAAIPEPTIGDLTMDLRRVMLLAKFGLDEMTTKLSILREEFRTIHDYNPIEHLGSRIKSFESIVAKARRRGLPMRAETIAAEITDIAGFRVTCSFISDIYRLRDMLASRDDLCVVEERDYIAQPRPSGYKSMHMIVRVPVRLTDRVEHVTVEIQLRTIAMDFWASLEHKIQYKWGREVPAHLKNSLYAASLVAANLDSSMERIHEEVKEAMPPATMLKADADLTPAEQFDALMLMLDVTGS